MRVEKLDGRGGKVAPRNAGLVGDEEGEQATVVDRLHRFDRALDPFHLVDAVDVAVVDIEHTVSVEKHGRSPEACGHEGVGVGQRIRLVDVEEETCLQASSHRACGR